MPPHTSRAIWDRQPERCYEQLKRPSRRPNPNHLPATSTDLCARRCSTTSPTDQGRLPPILLGSSFSIMPGGPTASCLSFADEVRAAGHVVHAPDLYDGKVFTDLTDGGRHSEQLGFELVIERGRLAAERPPKENVCAGFSRGAVPVTPTFNTCSPTPASPTTKRHRCVARATSAHLPR